MKWSTWKTTRNSCHVPSTTTADTSIDSAPRAMRHPSARPDPPLEGRRGAAPITSAADGAAPGTTEASTTVTGPPSAPTAWPGGPPAR